MRNFIIFLMFCFLMMQCANVVEEFNTISNRNYKKVTGFVMDMNFYIATVGKKSYNGTMKSIQSITRGRYNQEKVTHSSNSHYVNADFINSEEPFVLSLFDSNIQYHSVDVSSIKNHNKFSAARSLPLASGEGDISVDMSKYRVYFSDFALGSGTNPSLFVTGLARFPMSPTLTIPNVIWMRGTNHLIPIVFSHELGHTFSLHHTNTRGFSCTGGISAPNIMLNVVIDGYTNFDSCEINIIKQSLNNLSSKYASIRTVDYLYEDISTSPDGSSSLPSQAMLYRADDPNISYAIHSNQEANDHADSDAHAYCGVDHSVHSK